MLKISLPDKICTSSSSKYLIPPLLIGSSIFIASSYKSFLDKKIKNEELVTLYIQEKIDTISPRSFLDFAEPQLISQKKDF